MSILTDHKTAIIGSVIALTVTGASALAVQTTQTGAEEVPPLVQQVNDHEVRIDTLEGQQEDTEATVTQQGQEITVLQQTIAPAAPTQPIAEASVTPAPAPTEPSEPTAPTPAPAPVPVIDPRTITAVVEGTQGSLRTCDYTLYGHSENAAMGIVLQPMSLPCYTVGEVLPRL